MKDGDGNRPAGTANGKPQLTRWAPTGYCKHSIWSLNYSLPSETSASTHLGNRTRAYRGIPPGSIKSGSIKSTTSD